MSILDLQSLDDPTGSGYQAEAKTTSMTTVTTSSTTITFTTTH